MIYKRRQSMKDFARYMVDKYTTIERLKKNDERRREFEALKKEAPKA